MRRGCKGCREGRASGCIRPARRWRAARAWTGRLAGGGLERAAGKDVGVAQLLVEQWVVRPPLAAGRPAEAERMQAARARVEPLQKAGHAPGMMIWPVDHVLQRCETGKCPGGAGGRVVGFRQGWWGGQGGHLIGAGKAGQGFDEADGWLSWGLVMGGLRVRCVVRTGPQCWQDERRRAQHEQAARKALGKPQQAIDAALQSVREERRIEQPLDKAQQAGEHRPVLLKACGCVKIGHAGEYRRGGKVGDIFVCGAMLRGPTPTLPPSTGSG